MLLQVTPATARIFKNRVLLSPRRVIQDTNKTIATVLRGDLKILRKISAYVIQSGGKRIRPLFQYYLGKSYGLDSTQLIRLGALLEIVHTASLLHDDVVDEAEERRSQPTAAKLFGNKQVVLSGDHLLSSGLKYLNALGNPHYMAIFTDALQALSRAELLQMQHHFDFSTSAAAHNQVIDGKTAVLFRAAGALVAVMRGHKTDYYKQDTAALGELFGRFFQERDDHLDYFDAGRLKKKGLQDFTNGIVTHPLIYLIQAANSADRRALKAAWEHTRKTGVIADTGKITALFSKYAIERHSQAQLAKKQTAILNGLARLPGKEPRDVIIAEFQKILAVRGAENPLPQYPKGD